MMQSVEEHRGILKGEVAVMPVRGLRRRRRVRELAAGRRQKPKERTLGYCGSRKRVTVAGKRTSPHTTVAWRKRNQFRKSWSQENCGRRKKLTAAGMRMARSAKWHGAGNTMARDMTRSMWDKKPRNNERTGRDCGNIWNATRA
jgi:hypothetical protein